jgi:hypothetical protein
MKWVKDDGGRATAGFKGRAGDCVCRAVAIASGRPYQEVYDKLAQGNATQRRTSRRKVTRQDLDNSLVELRDEQREVLFYAQNEMRNEPKRSRRIKVRTAREGINTNRKWFKDYMAELGFEWVSCMGFTMVDGARVGTGCQVHLDENELPSGRLVVSLSRHMSAVIDGVIHDTYDPNDRGATIYPNSFPMDQLPKAARRMTNGNGWIYDPKRCVYGYWRLTAR